MGGCGIAGIEIAFPSGYLDVGEMAATSGIDAAEIRKSVPASRFPALSEDEASWEVACKACRALLHRTGVEKDNIQQVIYAGSGEWDHPFWSPSAKVAAELGISTAHCFEVTNFCNAGSIAIRIANDAVLSGRVRNVLVVVCDRLSRMVDHGDPASRGMFNFGDAAAAVLVSCEGRDFRLLHSEMRTDPHWVDHYRGLWRSGGGVEIRKMDDRPGLKAAYLHHFSAMTRSTLETIGRRIDDVDYVLVNHGSQSTHKDFLREVGVPESRSVFNYAELAHMGGADTLIALKQLLDATKLKPGSIVLLATSAMGFSWGITALQYDPLR